jgi:hypothetical protein
VCFVDYKKYFGTGDGIGNLLEHLPLLKGQFFGTGERDE